MTVVAIDGPTGSGKSTVARMVAARLGYLYLDTGAMYRAVGLLATEAGVRLDDEAAVVPIAAAADLRFDGDGRLFAGDRDVSGLIRSLEMGAAASVVSVLPGRAPAAGRTSADARGRRGHRHGGPRHRHQRVPRRRGQGVPDGAPGGAGGAPCRRALRERRGGRRGRGA